MYRRGHIGLNAIAYAPLVPIVSSYLSIDAALWGALVVVVTATLPDADERLPVIDHRGPTHTIWFAAIVGVLVGVATLPLGFATPSISFWFGFFLGAGSVVTHLAGDVVTPMGVRPLPPITKRHVSLDLVPSKNERANDILLVMGTVALAASAIGTVALVSDPALVLSTSG